MFHSGFYPANRLLFIARRGCFHEYAAGRSHQLFCHEERTAQDKQIAGLDNVLHKRGCQTGDFQSEHVADTGAAADGSDCSFMLVNKRLQRFSPQSGRNVRGACLRLLNGNLRSCRKGLSVPVEAVGRIPNAKDMIRAFNAEEFVHLNLAPYQRQIKFLQQAVRSHPAGPNQRPARNGIAVVQHDRIFSAFDNLRGRHHFHIMLFQVFFRKVNRFFVKKRQDRIGSFNIDDSRFVERDIVPAAKFRNDVRQLPDHLDAGKTGSGDGKSEPRQVAVFFETSNWWTM